MLNLPGGVHVLVDVQLHDLQLARVFAGDFFHRGRQHVARTAPIGPEIHHHRLRLARVDHVGLKVRVVDRLNTLSAMFSFRCAGRAT